MSPGRRAPAELGQRPVGAVQQPAGAECVERGRDDRPEVSSGPRAGSKPRGEARQLRRCVRQRGERPQAVLPSGGVRVIGERATQVVEHEAQARMPAGDRGGLPQLPVADDEIERQVGLLERREARTHLRPEQPLRVRVDVDQVAHSDDGDVGGSADAVELVRYVPLQVDPHHHAGDDAPVRAHQPETLLEAVARLHDDRAVHVGRREHRRQLGRPEVAVDGRHGDRIDPILRVQRPVPEVDVGVDARGHPRCHTSSSGCQSDPGSRSSAIRTWHGSVCVSHCCVTGSSSIRRMSAS